MSAWEDIHYKFCCSPQNQAIYFALLLSELASGLAPLLSPSDSLCMDSFLAYPNQQPSEKLMTIVHGKSEL